MTWNKTVPVTGTYMVDSSSVYIGNWTHIENVLGFQHYTFTDTASGKHKPGLTPMIFTGATSSINALSATTVSGSVAFDTTIGSTRVFDSANVWKLAALWPTTRVLVYRNGDQTISAATETTIAFNTDVTDILSEYDAVSTYKFVPLASGFFYVYGQVSFVAVGGVNVDLSIQHTNSSGATKNKILYSNYAIDSNPITMKVFGILEISLGDKLYFTIAHDRSTSCLVEGGATKSYIRIQRLS